MLGRTETCTVVSLLDNMWTTAKTPRAGIHAEMHYDVTLILKKKDDVDAGEIL